MVSVIDRIRARRWNYADLDPAARTELESRLADTARREGLVRYSDLVRGIIFNLPNVQSSLLELGVPDWTDLHRAILGDFLGRISCDSYERAGFLASAVAVSGSTGEPSEGFRELVRELGLTSTHGAAYLAFWGDQVHPVVAKTAGGGGVRRPPGAWPGNATTLLERQGSCS